MRPLATILVLLVGLVMWPGCGGAAFDLMGAAGRLGQNLTCTLECAACIQALHSEGGAGFDAAVEDQARCAAACARCAVDVAEDCAGIAAAGSDAAEGTDVVPEPLPPGEVRERVTAAAAAYQPEE